jgi:hypothetical protein
VPEGRIVTDMLDTLERDMFAAIKRMPDNWDEAELGWYLVRRAEMSPIPHADRLRRRSHENALRTWRL